MRGFVAVALVLVVGCGGRPVSVDVRADGGGPTDAAPADGRPWDTCPCAPHQVQLIGSCTPTDKLWSCGASCSTGMGAPCLKGYYCMECSGSPPCGGSSCQSACVPEPQAAYFSPGTLRIAPTVAKAGQPVKLTIEGGLIYWGNGWSVRIGTGPSQYLVGSSALSCKVTVTLTPTHPGPHPVEIIYGKGGPGTSWSLAGILMATAGTTPPVWIQPGRPCSSKYPCASAAPYTCACHSGRCVCE